MNWEARVYHLVNGEELQFVVQYDEWSALITTIGALIGDVENITKIDVRRTNES
jgi:hypothetical protein